MRRIVIDSSIVSKWFFPQEELVNEANEILADFKNGLLKLYAPSILAYEIINVLALGTIRLRINYDKARGLLQYFRFLNISLVNFDSFYEEALELSVSNKISIYDTSFIVLASKIKVDFYTADKKLVGKVSKEFSFVRYLSDYYNS